MSVEVQVVKKPIVDKFETWTELGGLTLTRGLGEGIRIIVGDQVIDVLAVMFQGKRVRLKVKTKDRSIAIHRFTVGNFEELVRAKAT